MRLKIFTADNMQAALLMVREALGDDAIIIDTTEKKGKVKVTAAIEIPVAKVSPRKASKPRPRPAPVKKSLKELQQDEQSESVNLSHFLSHHDIPKVMMKRILETADSFDEDSNMNALARALDIMFHFSPINNDFQKRPIMLVGPPGVGKTVTAAKLTSQAVLAGRQVRLINTDTLRTGGTAQLEGYGLALQISVIEAPEPDLLAAAINTNKQPDELVIIDTAGYNPFDRHEMNQLHRLIQVCDVEPLLVIAAGSDKAEAQEIAETYANLGVRRFIATRLDVARRYASLLTTAAAMDLAFAGVGITPYLAEGIERIDFTSFARLLTRVPDRKIFTPAEEDNPEENNPEEGEKT